MERKDGMPFWAYLGLLGINSKKLAIGAAIFCVIAGNFAIIPLPGVPIDLKYIAMGILCFGIAIWIWLSVKWVDKHSEWE